MNKDKSQILTFLRPAADWREATPLGNGRMGALVPGGVGDERIVLNAEDLYVGAVRAPLPDLSDKLPEVRALIKAGRLKEAERVYPDAFAARGGGGSVGKYAPLADLLVRADVRAPFTDYRRKLDMRTGESSVFWREGGCAMEKRCFVSRTENALYIRLCLGRDAAVRVSVCPHDRADDRNLSGDRLDTPVRIFAERADGGLNFRVSVAGSEERTVSVRADRAVRLCPGERDAGQLGVPELPMTQPFLAYDGGEITFRVTLGEDAGGAVDYAAALQRTEEINADILGGSDFWLGDEDDRPVDLLLLGAESGNPGVALIEKAAKFGRYLLAASGVGGVCPPNLQGIWNGAYDPPWFAAYFMNENLPMCLWQALPGALPQAMLPAFGLAERLMDDFRENARKLFGCRGIYVPVYFTPASGLATDFQPHVLYWTAGAAWLAGMFYDYWRFTGDGAFLRSRALPFMREAAAFYRDFLVEEGGELRFVPSVSPENCALGDFEDAGEVFVSENAAMDVAAVKELFLSLADCGEREYAALAARLPAYRTGDRGEFREWLADGYR